ncbi:TfoX/Sxy family protein [Hylemonella gracilis]|uniref:Regulator of competence-specific genes n=1 Tax=Hylemonella gracilis ATCC 19624 TaxID=887062 RepID=F3KR59_9BURK|nr:TfoX/Sxy family protein [Hylemonella gracilis]EGI77760.1 regulator of competence-specific genes [Hylemonella gracilis ATCC 19624]
MSTKRTTPSSPGLRSSTRSSSRARKSPLSAPASVAAELAAQLNLGPKSAQALVAAGITSLAELRSLGSVAAYAKVKQHTPAATLNLLWALEGALSSLPWQTVAHEHRTSLLLALEQYQNGG